ncbi:MAG: integrase DNA-binding domain-containing protein [Erysipelotrichaceae bacterium]|nr:integrase DNA-binding domain-containing protein [Erysipelotrichaceae bacterium]
MAKRKDSKKRLLKPGEGVRIKDGKETYYYRWTDITGKRRYIYSVDLNKLRKRENQIKADEICGIRSAENVTVNDVYSMWLKVKRGLKSNTLSTYKYTYEHYVYPTIGKKKISVITKMNIRLFYIELVEKQN